MKLEVERENFFRSSKANTHRQLLTPTGEEGRKKKYLCHRGSEEEMEKLLGANKTHAETHAHSHLSRDHVFFFQLLSFTSADHFSIEHETQPACHRSASTPFFTLCKSGPGSEDWERSRTVDIHNGGNNDNESDDSKNSPVWRCVLP